VTWQKGLCTALIRQVKVVQFHSSPQRINRNRFSN